MRAFLIALGWAATVAAAFLLGTTMGEEAPGPAQDDAVVRPLAEPAPTDPGPVLAPGASRDRFRPTGASAEGAQEAKPPSALEAGETLEPFTLEGVTDPDVAMGRIMRHIAAMLAKGKEGHLEILEFIDKELRDNDAFEKLFRSEEQIARYIYPWIEFMVQRKGQVVGVIGTVYETMAENPSFFEGIDDDTVEIFTEGASFVLPGAVDEEQLAVFREHARKILETPEGTLPEAIEKERRHIRQALALWTPRLGADEALARLEAGEIRGAEAMQLLITLPPEQLRELDLGTLLAPAVASGDYRVIRMLRDIELQPRDVDHLDRTLAEAAAQGHVGDWAVVIYLGATDRGAWPAGQTYIEQLLARGGAATEMGALAIGRLGKVPKVYARWVLDTYELSENAVRQIKRRFGIE